MVVHINTMDDFSIVYTPVPPGSAITGEKLYDAAGENTVVQIRNRWEPIYAYCYSCTNTTEYDARWKESRPKKMKEDEFNQVFKRKECDESPSGYTNQCVNCGFEMKDYEPDAVKTEEDKGEDADIEWMNTGYLYEGGWWFTMDKIKDMLKMGYGSATEIHFAFVIEGQTRLLPYDKLREVIKSKMILNRDGSSDLGFPIHMFRTL